MDLDHSPVSASAHDVLTSWRLLEKAWRDLLTALPVGDAGRAAEARTAVATCQREILKLEALLVSINPDLALPDGAQGGYGERRLVREAQGARSGESGFTVVDGAALFGNGEAGEEPPAERSSTSANQPRCTGT